MNNPAAILGLMGMAAQGIDYDSLVYREPRPTNKKRRGKRNKQNRIAKQSRKRNRS